MTELSRRAFLATASAAAVTPAPAMPDRIAQTIEAVFLVLEPMCDGENRAALQEWAQDSHWNFHFENPIAS